LVPGIVAERSASQGGRSLLQSTSQIAVSKEASSAFLATATLIESTQIQPKYVNRSRLVLPGIVAERSPSQGGRSLLNPPVLSFPSPPFFVVRPARHEMSHHPQHSSKPEPSDSAVSPVHLESSFSKQHDGRLHIEDHRLDKRLEHTPGVWNSQSTRSTS
jgi:hypothetical protein